jgi:hypothetical protein
MTDPYKIFVGKPEAVRQFGRPKLRFEDNIKVEFKGTSREGVDWFRLDHDRDQWWSLVNAAMNLRIP